MSFWAHYVILKENQGTSRELTLAQIEAKYGPAKRQEIEQELNASTGQ
ncbi:hypothetical protein [Paenibacillus sp. sgz302251]